MSERASLINHYLTRIWLGLALSHIQGDSGGRVPRLGWLSFWPFHSQAVFAWQRGAWHDWLGSCARCWNIQINVNPTQVCDHQGHPEKRLRARRALGPAAPSSLWRTSVEAVAEAASEEEVKVWLMQNSIHFFDTTISIVNQKAARAHTKSPPMIVYCRETVHTMLDFRPRCLC